MTTKSQTDMVRHVDYSVRAHITYTVHEYISQGSSGSMREVVRALPLAEALSMAELHARSAKGQVTLRSVDERTDVYAPDSIPLGLQHAFQELCERPKGTKWVLSVVSRMPGPMLRMQRLTPQEIPLKSPEDPWDKLTVGGMRETLAVLGALPWEAAKTLRLQAYHTRDEHLVRLLNRAQVAMDVNDPNQFFPSPINGL